MSESSDLSKIKQLEQALVASQMREEELRKDLSLHKQHLQSYRAKLEEWKPIVEAATQHRLRADQAEAKQREAEDSLRELSDLLAAYTTTEHELVEIGTGMYWDPTTISSVTLKEFTNPLPRDSYETGHSLTVNGEEIARRSAIIISDRDSKWRGPTLEEMQSLQRKLLHAQSTAQGVRQALKSEQLTTPHSPKVQVTQSMGQTSTPSA